MMQRRNKPIIVNIDTGDNAVTLPTLLFALSQKVQSTTFSGHIRYIVNQRGLNVITKQSELLEFPDIAAALAYPVQTESRPVIINFNQQAIAA